MKKSYYAIIPANVRYDENLMPNAKLLYGEITALCNEKGYCWASNDYFAKLYNVSKASVKKWLKSLENNGYIHREVKYKEGKKEIDTRWITIITHPGQEKLPTPGQEKYPDNTTSFNNTFNKDRSSAKLTDNFEKLWELYPNKKGKKQAFTKYKKYIKEGTTDKQIEQGIQSYLKEIKLKKTEKQYIKHGSTWFNNRGWEDEYETGNSKKKDKLSIEEQLKKGGVNI